MKTILVTGADGFIGRNLIDELKKVPDTTILTFGRRDSKASLRDKVTQSDVIYHLASVMRPTDESEFQTVNIDLTKDILSYIHDAKTSPIFVFTSSVHVEFDTNYGRSKLAAEEAVIEYSSLTKNKAVIYRLPNVFGRWAKPNYSVVAIFCNNVANGTELVVNEPKKVMTFAYIDDVTKSMALASTDILLLGKGDLVRPIIEPQYSITLNDLANVITSFKNSKPSKDDPHINQLLYKTYVSFI